MNTIIKYEGQSRHFFIEAGQTVVLVNPNKLVLKVTGPDFNRFYTHYMYFLIARDLQGNNLWTSKRVVNGKRLHPMSDFIYFFKNIEKDGAIYLEVRPK